MRIFFISCVGGSPWGGSEELWSRTAHEAISTGFEVAFSTYEWPETPVQVSELIDRGAKWFPRSRPQTATLLSKVWNRVRRGSNNNKGLRKSDAAVLKSIEEYQPDVICISEGGTFNRGMVKFLDSIRSTGIPYLMICQNGKEDGISLDDSMRKSFRDIFNGAYLVGFPAGRNIRNAERMLAEKLRKARVIQNPIPDASAALLDWPSDSKMRFVAAGRLHPDKGHDLLLDALSSPKWRDRDWELNIYGEGPNLSWLQELAAFLDIREKVHFRGHVSDMTEIWQGNHLTILSSRTEGAPLMMMQSMVFGRPVLVTDVGGNCDWVSEPETGFVAEGTTVGSIEAALDRAWNGRQNLQTMGMVGRRATLEKLDQTPFITFLTELSNAGSMKRNEVVVRAELTPAARSNEQ